jgi:Thioredoxin
MTQNLTPLFQYLEKENITIDKSEFEFQIQSHPDYPSLLSIADTLSFFKIDNLATRIVKNQIDILPSQFMAYLNEELNPPSLFFIEKKGENYLIFEEKKTNIINRKDIENRWLEIVLIVEKPEFESTKIKKNNFNWLFLSLLILAFSGVLYSLHATIKEIFFFIFPVIGFVFSVAALKDLFDTKSELLNSFCNMTVSTSCTKVVGSSKWKIFEIVNFSDLSMVFFGSQFFGLLAFLLAGSATAYFDIQQILLLSAVPVLLASLYYQKYVEKKWCPICLVIISIILLELGYLFTFQNVVFFVAVPPLSLYGLIFLLVLMAWMGLKKLLTSQKELKEFQFKGSRFMRNYEIFKNTLLASNKTNYQSLSSGNLVVGNENALLKITLITNPFCGYCKEAHTIIEEILKKQNDVLYVDFRFNFNVEEADEQSKNVHQKLVRLYYDNGQEAFLKALHHWFENKDESQLIVSEKSTITDLKISKILQEQYLMNRANKISFTPAIIINQYQYPKMYDRTELAFFINDLLEDKF